MKVAITLNTSWNIYNFRYTLVKQLLRQGHEVIAIAPKDKYTPKLIDIGCSFENVTMDSRGASPIKDLGLIFELHNIYKRVKPDVILHYTIKPNIYGTMAAAKLGIPSINNISGLGTIFLNDNLVSKIAMSLYRFSFKYPKKVFFQNEEDYRLFQHKNLVEKNACEVIPGSGIDLNHFIPTENTDKQDEKPFTFLMISRLIIDKGIREYVEAARILREKGLQARFLLLGGLDEEHSRGIMQKELDQWVEQKTITYLGRTDDVRPFISDADCVVLPSYREGTPRTLLEASACAKPIVATDVPGCNNIVSHEINGLLCEVKNTNDLSAKMQKMFNLSNETRTAMGVKGREIVEQRFDQSIVIKSYTRAIEKYQPTPSGLKVAYAG